MGRPRKMRHEREEACKTGAWNSTEVRCPFFKGQTRWAIVCEGFYVGENIRRCMISEARKRAIMEELCCRNYENCPWFQLVYGTYDANGKKR